MKPQLIHSNATKNGWNPGVSVSWAPTPGTQFLTSRPCASGQHCQHGPFSPVAATLLCFMGVTCSNYVLCFYDQRSLAHCWSHLPNEFFYSLYSVTNSYYISKGKSKYLPRFNIWLHRFTCKETEPWWSSNPRISLTFSSHWYCWSSAT